jgi:peptide/nickel transport system permease protein
VDAVTTCIIRRLLHAVLVILILSIVVFFVMRLLPGDPVLMLITGDELAQTSGERLAQLRHEFGLDKPLLLQYVTWFDQLLKGDLESSRAKSCVHLRLFFINCFAINSTNTSTGKVFRG